MNLVNDLYFVNLNSTSLNELKREIYSDIIPPYDPLVKISYGELFMKPYV